MDTTFLVPMKRTEHVVVTPKPFSPQPSAARVTSPSPRRCRVRCVSSATTTTPPTPPVMRASAATPAAASGGTSRRSGSRPGQHAADPMPWGRPGRARPRRGAAPGRNGRPALLWQQAMMGVSRGSAASGGGPGGSTRRRFGTPGGASGCGSAPPRTRCHHQLRPSPGGRRDHHPPPSATTTAEEEPIGEQPHLRLRWVRLRRRVAQPLLPDIRPPRLLLLFLLQAQRPGGEAETAGYSWRREGRGGQLAGGARRVPALGEGRSALRRLARLRVFDDDSAPIGFLAEELSDAVLNGSGLDVDLGPTSTWHGVDDFFDGIGDLFPIEPLPAI
ncbi:unnamed protein product [Musa textilis]